MVTEPLPPGGAIVEPSGLTGYLADPRFVDELRDELGGELTEHAGLLLRSGPPIEAAWALDRWLDPVWIRFPSVSSAARALRGLGSRWVHHPSQWHRRAALIAAAVRSPVPPPLEFPPPSPPGRWGGWLLVDPHTIVAAARCTGPFPLGQAQFVEDHRGPPSRAYRKLWECFVRLNRWPAPAESCVDLGASPGSWTWALQQLGARVIAVDKAPLDSGVAKLARVRTIEASAFGLEPASLGPVDWLFSDVICYPEALLRLVRRWLEAGACKNAVCTIKLQGATDRAAVEQFAAIEGSRLMHLSHNRHELTWTWSDRGGGHLAGAQVGRTAR